MTEAEGRISLNDFFLKFQPSSSEYEGLVINDDDEESSITSGEPLPKHEKLKSVWG